ncbi:cucumisin [Phtheirospermum japonicum]|uniref:Cucumisin n=1 Tax=Phtheirospermum japonicum TaxID=374723 RepID=A0A830BGY3_9LAMI|nr:cucumisin [Phtheirospermum japonicum]
MGNVVQRDQSPQSHHIQMLQEAFDTSFVRQSLVRSYTRSFNGFAVNLTAHEHEKLARHEQVVSIFSSTTFHPQTTRSWDFMGFSEKVHRNPTVESDTIIGVIDTGIWPESESFNDKGFGPPPKKWKGACNGGKNFTCNNKLIGARYYNSKSPTDDSARDNEGHGSHTASTAAGNHVQGASFYKIAKGTARGGVPSARIAAYKVCHKTECETADVLAAFDDAIADGVDIITVSLGGDPLQPEYDAVAIGALHALEKGVLVVQSAGNHEGTKTVSSVVPWIFSVAASSTDREIVANVALGNGTIGKSVNAFSLKGTSFPLVYGKEVSSKCDSDDSMDCAENCLDKSLAKGKIVLCSTHLATVQASSVGALGVVSTFDPELMPVQIFNFSAEVPLPAAYLSENDYKAVERFAKLDILKSESVRNLDAPQVANFSSRGPNIKLPDIMKPDITAPGVEILAAGLPSLEKSASNNNSAGYHVLSGTSMACPHVAGAAAYVKSFRPNWSPSAIKSALMTTAWKMDPKKDSLAEFSYGAGHIDPVKAVDPGLVYDTLLDDYAKMLCGLGYDAAKIRNIFGAIITCPVGPRTTPKDLNYPSMTSRIKTSRGKKSITFSKKFRRTVTNVGPGKSRYTVTTSTSRYYNITVKPNVLRFQAVGQKRSFNVIISGKVNYGEMVSASLEWSDGVHKVRSPIVVYPDDF